MTATFPSLQPSAKSSLVSVVEDHLNNIISQAVSISRKCKRARLASSPKGDHQHLHTRLHASDIHLAMQMSGSPRLFGHSDAVISGETSETAVVHLKDVLQAETLLEPPTEIAVHYSWLAVDGEATDPTIPTAAATDQRVNPTVALDDSATTLQIDRMIQSGLLSEELKLYYQRITTGLEEEVIANVSTTTGIQELVPFLVRFSVETLYETLYNGTNEDLARTMIRILQNLLLNVSLHMELQLHQVIPALLTACVTEVEYHHRCKLDAASALALIIRRFGTTHPTLAARITSVLAKAIIEPCTNDSSAGRVYGGLVGLTALGAVEAFAHVIAQSWEEWDPFCQQVALTAAVQSLDVRDIVGDRCVVHDTTLTNGYAHCFV